MNVIRKSFIFAAALFGATLTQKVHAQATAPSIPSILSIVSSNNSMDLTIYGCSGVTYSVNASTNLFTWQPIGTVGLALSGNYTPGYMAFQDTNAPLFRSRFYIVSGTNPPLATTTNPTVTVVVTNQVASYYLPTTLTVVAQNFGNGVSSVSLYDGIYPVAGAGAPQATNSFTWSSIVPGLHVFYAAATDPEGNTTWSGPTYVTVTPDPGATVVLTSPQASQTVTNGALINLAASVSDATAAVSWVEFFCDGYYVGYAYTPYSLQWARFAPLASGPHTAYVVAHDASGVDSTSDPVTFTIPPSPTVTLAPISGSTYPAAGSIPVAATVTNTLGSVTNLVLFVNGTALASSTNAPGSVLAACSNNWANVAEGTYALSAIAYDNQGNRVYSPTNTIYAFASTLVALQPAVTVMTTNAGQAICFASTLTITVVATGFGNGIAGVFLYDGDNEVDGPGIPQATNTFAWSSVDPGVHVFYAVAWDDDNIATWSAPTFVTMAPNAGATVALTSPQAGQTETNGADITFSAAATDSLAAVSWVEFFCDGCYVGYAYSPYTLEWTRFASLAAGPHTAFVVAHDANGINSTSAPVAFTVLAPLQIILTPTNGASYPTPGSILVTATPTNTRGPITNLVTLTNGVEWASYTNAPGQAPLVYSNTLLNLPAGLYTLSAIAYEDQGAVYYSPTNSFTVVEAAAPTVTWQQPAAGTDAYNQITNLQAIPSDQYTPIGAMTVSYYDNGTCVGQANSAGSFILGPYTPTPGTHTLKASTTNESGVSGYANLTVTVLSNRPPVITLISPTNNSNLPTSTVSVTGTASDPDNDPVTVVTYVDGIPQATNAASAGAYSSTVIVAPGSHTISAAAFSYGFGPIWSATNAVTVAIYPPAFTSISFDGHATNYSLNEPIQVEVAGIADPNLGGSVAQITFYVNGAVAATITNPASTVTQTVAASPLLGGSYACYAILTDTIGSTTQTPTITCQASNRAPTVAFVSPANNSSVGLALPTNLTVTVNASDPDAGDSVTNVVFYVNGQRTSTNTTSSWSWYVPSAGTYQLTAIAHDTHGLASLAASNSVTVTNTGASTVLSLDGLTGYMKLANPFPDMAVFSVECWIYSRTNTTTGILLMDSDSTVGYTILGIASNNIVLYANKSGGTLDTSVTVTNATLLNAWHHIAWTVSSTQSQLFVDGNLAATINEGGNNTGYHQTNPTIGAWNNGNSGPNRYFNGMLDEVRVWNIVLPQSQIQAQMNETLTGSEPGLIGYWNFDSGTANDGSPSGNNGTLVGGATILPHRR